jgi:hypothetical protein
MFKSKKFWAGLITAAVGYVLHQLGWSAGDVATVVGPLGAYVIGQGIADQGKEAAKIK